MIQEFPSPFRRQSPRRRGPGPAGGPTPPVPIPSRCQRPIRLRTRLWLHYSVLLASMLILSLMLVQFALARVTEQAAREALHGGITLPVQPARIAPADGVAPADATILSVAGRPAMARVLPDPSGPLLLSIPLDAARKPFDPIFAALLLAGALGLLLGAAGAWWIARDLTRPLEALGEALEALRTGEKTLLEPQGPREIRQLIEKANEAMTLSSRALRDPLTRLPNRMLLTETLHRVLAANEDVVLLGIGLDGLATVNASHGRAVGDRLLEATADRIERTAGRAMVARLGGGRFAVLLPADRGDGAEWIAGRLIDVVSHEIRQEGWSVQLGASAGVARAAPGVDAPTMLAEAEAALRAAKAAGRHGFVCCEAAPGPRSAA